MNKFDDELTKARDLEIRNTAISQSLEYARVTGTIYDIYDLMKIVAVLDDYLTNGVKK